MSKFKRGDRVRLSDATAHPLRGVVIGDTSNNPKSVVVGATDQNDHISVSIFHEDNLVFVPTPPNVERPFIVYQPDGKRWDSCESLSRAARVASVRPGYTIVNVMTGQWYDNEGQEIEP